MIFPLLLMCLGGNEPESREHWRRRRHGTTAFATTPRRQTRNSARGDRYASRYSGRVSDAEDSGDARACVRRLESDLQRVLDEIARVEFGREMHTFPYRRLGAL